jgi:hypothetical protein
MSFRTAARMVIVGSFFAALAGAWFVGLGWPK